MFDPEDGSLVSKEADPIARSVDGGRALACAGLPKPLSNGSWRQACLCQEPYKPGKPCKRGITVRMQESLFQTPSGF